MKMYKISTAMFIFFIISLTIIGCSKEVPIHKVSDNTQYSGTVVKMLNTSLNQEGIFFTNGLDINTEYKEILNYKDFSSQSMVAVCNKPNCNHSTEDKDCSAIYNGTIVAAFIGEDHLYVFTSVGVNTTCIYEACKDGSKRKLITTLNYSIINNINVYDHFANIPVVHYTEIEKKDAKGNIVGYSTSDLDASDTILQLDFETNKFTELFSPISKPRLRFGDITYSQDDLFINIEYAIDSDYEDTEYAIYQYNSSTKELKNIYTLNKEDTCLGIIKNHVYYYTLEDKLLKVYRSDLTLENAKCICEGDYTSASKLFSGIQLYNNNDNTSFFLNVISNEAMNITNNITKKAIAYSYINDEYCMAVFRGENFECGIISYENLISDNPEYIYTGSLKGQ